MCLGDLEVYLLDTGKYTSLIIEGFKSEREVVYHYDFYKKTFYPRHPNKVTVYGENLSPSRLLERVERYFSNRKRFLDERGT